MTEHDQRVQFLDALATLMGCRESLGGSLPDGLRPDVLRLDSKREVLFVGDAKDTETPGCLETQVRLQKYLRWVSVHVKNRKGIGIFALAFGRRSEADLWVKTISTLGYEAGLAFSDYGVEPFGPGLVVAWFLSSGATRYGHVEYPGLARRL